MKYYLNVLSNYINLTGRTPRMEFWMFVLINFIFASIAIFIDQQLHLCFKMEIGYGLQTLPFGPVYTFYSLITFVPTIAVQIRRLHDVGKTGWFLFLSLLPVIGTIWVLVLYCSSSSAGNNAYGPNPANKD